MEYTEQTELEIQTMPYSATAEEAILGAAMISTESVRDIDLTPADFYVQRNGWIWSVVSDLMRKSGQVDNITVTDELSARGKLDEIGGVAYLTRLIVNTGSTYLTPQYAAIVKDNARRRNLIAVANKLAQSAFDHNKPVDQTISEIAVRLPALCNSKTGARHVSEYVNRHYERIDGLANGAAQARIIPTGFKEFDEATGGGLREKELMWLIGLPGLGKTKWALQAAFQMGALGTGVVIYSWETGEEDIMDREISRQTRIPQSRLEKGDLKDDEWSTYTAIIDKLSAADLPIYIDFAGNMNATALRADLTRLKAEHNIQIFVIDYLKFIHDRLPGENDTAQQNRLSGALKSICNDLSLAAIVIDVFNKEGMKATLPTLDNQTQGADKSYDADKILFMVNHIPEIGKADSKVRTFIFGKSRRKLNISKPFFHMVAVDDFPEFGTLAR